MTNSKFTKRAAVLSALTVLMCMVMLAGTTFAWFTDSVSTGVNRIQAGNLSFMGARCDIQASGHPHSQQRQSCR